MANLPHSFVFLAFWNILVDEKYSFEASSDHRRKGDDGSCGDHNPIPCQDIEEHLFGDMSVCSLSLKRCRSRMLAASTSTKKRRSGLLSFVSL